MALDCMLVCSVELFVFFHIVCSVNFAGLY